jgi:hypothetical protein
MSYHEIDAYPPDERQCPLCGTEGPLFPVLVEHQDGEQVNADGCYRCAHYPSLAAAIEAASTDCRTDNTGAWSEVAAAWARVAAAKHSAEIAWTEVDQAERLARCLEDEVRVLTDKAEQLEAGAKAEQLARLHQAVTDVLGRDAVPRTRSWGAVGHRTHSDVHRQGQPSTGRYVESDESKSPAERLSPTRTLFPEIPGSFLQSQIASRPLARVWLLGPAAPARMYGRPEFAADAAQDPCA